MATTNPAPTRVSSKTVEKAVNALLKWENSKSQTQKPQLLEKDDFIYLILTLKKIPQNCRTNPYKIPLPHSLIRQEDDDPPEFCLIIDDRPKSSLTKDAALKKIKNDELPIAKVVKITKLKTDYRPFEAKRKLCDSYDMFFADKRVVPLLPKLLGKHFFKKKKIPVPMDLKHNNWKEQIEKVCESALLYLRTGTCSVLKVGKVSMGTKEIVENVMAAINGIAEIVPRKWGNVRSFHLKMLESLALPVYQAVPDMRLKIEGIKDREEKVVDEKVEKENVKAVDDDGNKKKSKKKGRIHEIRYMDSNIEEVFDEDELVSDDGIGDVGESVDGEGDFGESDDGEAGEMGSAEILSKKSLKGNKGKAEKLPKKVAKVKKDDDIKKMKKMADVKQKKKKEEGLSLKKDWEDFSGKMEKKSSSPSSLQLRKVKSQPQPETQPSKNSDDEKEDDKNEEIPVERSEEEQEEVEVAEEFQDKAISGEVKNVTVSKSPPQTFLDVEMEDGVDEDEADETEEIDEEDEEEFEEVTEADDEIQKKRVDIKEINVEELKPPSVLVINQFPTSPDFKKSSPGSDAEECINFPQTHNKLQNLVDLVMWRDVPKSALIFGMGSFIIISSSYTTDLNISFISVVSYLGLVYLAAIFLYRSIICRGYINIEDDSSYVVGQEEAIWLVKLFLPYLNEFLLKLKALFSGDPATTMKLAVLLFVLARCGNSITIWKMAKLGFFGVFIVPKVCSSYSTQLAAYGKFWIRRFRDAWDSCSHKKAVAGAIFTLVWNLSSMVARIWAVFVLFVAFRYYQQSMMRDEWVEDDTTVGEETCNGPQIKQQKEVFKPNNNGQKPINARYKPNNEVNRPLRGWRRPTIAQTNKAKKAS